MARKRRDEEVVISALKRVIADKSCPVGGRIYCIVVLAVLTKMLDAKYLALMPGVPRIKLAQPETAPVPLDTTIPVVEQPQVDVTDFLTQLGGDRAT